MSFFVVDLLKLLRLQSLCILQGEGGEEQRIFFKGAKFFKIPRPHIIQNFLTTPLMTKRKNDPPPPTTQS